MESKLKTVAELSGEVKLALSAMTSGSKSLASQFDSTLTASLSEQISTRIDEAYKLIGGQRAQLGNLIASTDEGLESQLESWLSQMLFDPGSPENAPTSASPLSFNLQGKKISPEVIRLAEILAEIDTLSTTVAVGMATAALGQTGVTLTSLNGLLDAGKGFQRLTNGDIESGFDDVFSNSGLWGVVQDTDGFESVVSRVGDSLRDASDELVQKAVKVGAWFTGGNSKAFQGIQANAGAAAAAIGGFSAALGALASEGSGVEKGMAVASAAVGIATAGIQVAVMAGAIAASSAVPIAGWVVAAVLAIATAITAFVMRRKRKNAEKAIKAEVDANKTLVNSSWKVGVPGSVSDVFEEQVRLREKELAKGLYQVVKEGSALTRLVRPPSFSDLRMMVSDPDLLPPNAELSFPTDSYILDGYSSNGFGYVPGLGQTVSTIHLGGTNAIKAYGGALCFPGADCTPRVTFGGSEMAIFNKSCSTVMGAVDANWSLLYRMDCGQSVQREWLNWLGELFTYTLPAAGYVMNVSWSDADRLRAYKFLDQFEYPTNFTLGGSAMSDLAYAQASSNGSVFTGYIDENARSREFRPRDYVHHSKVRLEDVYKLFYSNPQDNFVTAWLNATQYPIGFTGPAGGVIQTGPAALWDWATGSDFQFFPLHLWQDAISAWKVNPESSEFEKVFGRPDLVEDLKARHLLQSKGLYAQQTGQYAGIPLAGVQLFSVDPDNLERFPAMAYPLRRQWWNDGIMKMLSIPNIGKLVALCDVANPNLRNEMAQWKDDSGDLKFSKYLSPFQLATQPFKLGSAINPPAPGGTRPSTAVSLPVSLPPRPDDPRGTGTGSSPTGSSSSGSKLPLLLAGGVALAGAIWLANRKDRRTS